ncbi:MAG: hypothetical protein ACUVX8_11465 [Candidatus Zipacnadales bacterium]
MLTILRVSLVVLSLCRAEAIFLCSGPHLFIDDYLIAEQSNLTRLINHPVKLPEPVVTGPEDHCFQPYLTVLRDPDSGLFRIWYGVPESASQSHLAYMESNDGIHWKRPPRVLTDPTPIQFGVSILDEGPDYVDPSARYKYGYWHEGGLKIAASPDGLVWTPLAPGVVLSHNHDINSIFRDPLRNRYIAFISSYTEGPTWIGQRRISLSSVSDDLLHWREPWVIFAPDEQDEGETQFYCMDGVIVRGNLLIGLLKVLRDDLPADPGGPRAGIGYTVLAWSHDGEHWTRDREPFLDRGPAGAWDHAMTWGDEQLIVGEETFIYYGGYKQGHKINRFTERQIGLARMLRDRYIARRAGNERGYLRTPLLNCEGLSLTINAAVQGYVRLRLLDEAGTPLPGFDWDDCQPIRGNAVDLPVAWRSPDAQLPRGPFCIEFALRNADLYGFRLTAS